jgi:hypothetical protein
MAIMTDTQSVLANAVVQNALAGKSQEFVKEPSVVSFSMTGSAIGLFATCIVGEEVVMEDQAIPLTNRFPIVPDDSVCQAGGFPGDRIIVKLRNSTGGALTSWVRVDIEPA